MNDNTTTTVADALASNYMLADLLVRIWSGRKTDRNATTELLASKHAAGDAAVVVKKLFAGNDTELKEVQSLYTSVRTWFYANTLTLGSKLYAVSTIEAMGFLTEFAELKRAADTTRDDFVDNAYDAALANAQTSLGDLYDVSHYPTKDQVRGMFGAELDVRPLPAVSDFDRLSIPSKLAGGLKDLYERNANSQAETAISDVQERLIAELDRMSTQLSKVAKGEKTRLYKSLKTNMERLVSMARGISPLDNGRLAEIANHIEARLLQNEVADYKDNASLSGAVATAAEELKTRLTSDEGSSREPSEPEPSTQEAVTTEVIDTTSSPGEPVNNDTEVEEEEPTPDFSFDSLFYG